MEQVDPLVVLAALTDVQRNALVGLVVCVALLVVVALWKPVRRKAKLAKPQPLPADTHIELTKLDAGPGEEAEDSWPAEVEGVAEDRTDTPDTGQEDGDAGQEDRGTGTGEHVVGGHGVGGHGVGGFVDSVQGQQESPDNNDDAPVVEDDRAVPVAATGWDLDPAQQPQPTDGPDAAVPDGQPEPMSWPEEAADPTGSDPETVAGGDDEGQGGNRRRTAPALFSSEAARVAAEEALWNAEEALRLGADPEELPAALRGDSRPAFTGRAEDPVVDDTSHREPDSWHEDLPPEETGDVTPVTGAETEPDGAPVTLGVPPAGQNTQAEPEPVTHDDTGDNHWGWQPDTGPVADQQADVATPDAERQAAHSDPSDSVTEPAGMTPHRDGGGTASTGDSEDVSTEPADDNERLASPPGHDNGWDGDAGASQVDPTGAPVDETGGEAEVPAPDTVHPEQPTEIGANLSDNEEHPGEDTAPAEPEQEQPADQEPPKLSRREQAAQRRRERALARAERNERRAARRQRGRKKDRDDDHQTGEADDTPVDPSLYDIPEPIPAR